MGPASARSALSVSCFLSLVSSCSGGGASGGASCSSALDCYNNGDCVAGACVCDAAWDGAECDWLALAPTATQLWPPPGYVPQNASSLASSWGATIRRDDAGVFHAFFDVVCGAYTWMHVQGAVIVHARAPALEGPYVFAEVALPQQTINPHLVRAPDSAWLLAACHDVLPAPLPVCTGDAATDARSAAARAAFFAASQPPSSSQPSDCKGNNPGSFQIARAATLDGPWVMLNASISGSNATVPNPNPSLLPASDGSALLAYTRNVNDPVGVGERVNIARAAVWEALSFAAGPLDPIGTPGEDPFLFSSARGLHIVFHAFSFGNNTGGYAVTDDPTGRSNWRFVPGGIYNTSVSLAAGVPPQSFARRERPEFLFDDAGAITHLLTGCELVKEDGHSSLSVLHAVRRTP
jgi:hypothetical protein